MPSSAGPNTVSDSIVFNYDIGDIRNSYKGEPTTNLVTDPDGNANIITTDVPIGVNVVGYAQYSSGYYVNPRSTTSTSATGNTFTYSVYMRSQSSPASTYLMYVFTGTGPDGGWWYFGDGSLTSDWQRYTYTRSDLTGTVSLVTVYRYNQLGTIDIAAPQIEIKPHATQFVKGTRSSTQGLLDLSGRGNTIDLVNMTYGANNAISFDGTDDRIRVAQNNEFFINTWTWEMVVKYNGNTGTYQGLVWAEGDTGGGSGLQYLLTLYNNSYFHYRINNSATGWANTDTSTINFTPTNYNHIVWQFIGGITNIYINGSLFHTNSSRGAYNGGTNSPMFFGTRNDAAYASPMVAPIYKYYNRTLSATEIANNYRQYKTRFNLP